MVYPDADVGTTINRFTKISNLRKRERERASEKCCQISMTDSKTWISFMDTSDDFTSQQNGSVRSTTTNTVQQFSTNTDNDSKICIFKTGLTKKWFAMDDEKK